MRNAVSGAIVASVAIALTGAASAQSTSQYDYNANYGAATTVAPYTPPSYQGTGNYATSTPMPAIGGTPGYAPPAATSYTQPVTSYTDSGTSYATPSTAYAQPAPNYTAPAAPAYTQPAPSYTEVPVYTQPGTTTPSYAAQDYAAPATTYSAPIYSQPLPAPSYTPPSYTSPVPATAYTPATPTPTEYASSDVIQDDDGWTMNLARFYPAIQACLRRSTVKNPVVANVQQSGNQTVMLIAEGGSSSFSTCKTGLTGTTIKASTETRPVPPAFFAPLGSTFTVSPDRPFQPVVDTNQKVIGWMVRTQPVRVPFAQYGQPGAPGFDGQFIPPLMVNPSVGAS